MLYVTLPLVVTNGTTQAEQAQENL
jgi:hypothetical protein